MENSLSNMEKRASQRLPVRIEFQCCNIDYYGIIANVSANGIFIESKKITFPLESQFEICIPLKNNPLNVRVKINRITKSNGCYDGIGVEVLGHPQKYLKLVNRLNFSLKYRDKNISIGGDKRDFFNWYLFNRNSNRKSL
jgi:hypothetical protein